MAKSCASTAPAKRVRLAGAGPGSQFHIVNKRFKSVPGTQTLRRGIAVLKAFDEADPAHTLSGVAARVGLNKSTAHRLLGALEAEGLVVHDGELYRLGPEAVVLGARAARSRDLLSVAKAELAALARESGETVTLETLVGDDVLILDEVHGRHLIGTMPAVGTRWPAHATATGKVLLACTGARRAGARLSKHTRATITTTRRLQDELTRVAQQGFATNLEELETGFVAVAAPIRDQDDTVVGAVSVGGPATRLTSARVASLATSVKSTAARISQQLGYRS
jgi:IclR family transcriptional regulator, acetate operon repressor